MFPQVSGNICPAARTVTQIPSFSEIITVRTVRTLLYAKLYNFSEICEASLGHCYIFGNISKYVRIITVLVGIPIHVLNDSIYLYKYYYTVGVIYST